MLPELIRRHCGRGIRLIDDVIKIARQFALIGNAQSAQVLGTGLIHDTYLLSSDHGGQDHHYVLQRINSRVFADPEALIANAVRVIDHIVRKTKELVEGSAYQSLTFVRTHEGLYSYKYESGVFWRGFDYVSGTRTFNKVETVAQAYEAAAAFGHFQALIRDLPSPRLTEVIENFHDTPARFEQLAKAIDRDAHGRARQAATEIATARHYHPIADELLCLHRSGLIPERIVHNDTKINNVLFDAQSGKAICVVDLDTVMPGLSLFDFGDLVRTATMSADEDEVDLSKVSMRIEIFESLVEGYLSTAGEFLNTTELDHLALCGRTITIENAVRFLTDYLEGDHYFKVARPEQNLCRCRSQFALAASIDRQIEEMQAIVDAARARSGLPG